VTKAGLLEKAAEARVRAEVMTDPERRWLMLDIASQFEELAEQVDHLERMARRLNEHGRALRRRASVGRHHGSLLIICVSWLAPRRLH
jgi:hypothetical protein